MLPLIGLRYPSENQILGGWYTFAYGVGSLGRQNPHPAPPLLCFDLTSKSFRSIAVFVLPTPFRYCNHAGL